jgi:hypothetical protein
LERLREAATPHPGFSEVVYTEQGQVEAADALVMSYAQALADHLRSGAEPVPEELVVGFIGALDQWQESEHGTEWARLAERLHAVADAALELKYGEGTDWKALYAKHANGLHRAVLEHIRSLTPHLDRVVPDLSRQHGPYQDAAALADAEAGVAQAVKDVLDAAENLSLPAEVSDNVAAVAQAMSNTRGSSDGGIRGELNRYVLLSRAADRLSSSGEGTGPVATAAYVLWARANVHQARLDAFPPGELRQAHTMLGEALAMRGHRPAPERPARPRPVVLEHNHERTVLHIERGRDQQLDALAKKRALKYAPTVKAWKCPSNWKFRTRSERVTNLARDLALAGRPFQLEPDPPGKAKTRSARPAPSRHRTPFVLPTDREAFQYPRQAQSARYPIRDAVAELGRSQAWRHMSSTQPDATQEARDLAKAIADMHNTPIAGGNADHVMEVYTRLAERAHRLREDLATRDLNAPKLLAALRDLDRDATDFAARMHATAARGPGQWSAVFKSPPPNGRPAVAATDPTQAAATALVAVTPTAKTVPAAAPSSSTNPPQPTTPKPDQGTGR